VAQDFLTKINRVDTKFCKTCGTSFLGIFRTAIDFKGLRASDESKLGREEDVIAFAGALEPFSNEFFTVAIEAC